MCIALAVLCAAVATWTVLHNDTPERSPETVEQLRAIAAHRERGEREHFPR